jgi:hypothetical protein
LVRATPYLNRANLRHRAFARPEDRYLSHSVTPAGFSWPFPQEIDWLRQRFFADQAGQK